MNQFYRFLFLPVFLLAACSVFSQPIESTLLGRWDDESLIGSTTYNNAYNEIWGLAHDGREYAVLGSTAGTHFIDVTDPTQPEEVAFVAGAAQGSPIIHRDYHNYGCYLYAVCDESQSTLQIIDISYLPDSVSVVYDTDETLRRAHNIFIDTAQATLYCFAAFGGDQFTSAMRLYDISSPTEPEFLAEYNQFGEINAGHVHDGYVHDGYAYLNCGNDGFAIVDFTDRLNPQTLGTATQYPFAGYNHSGWPSKDGQYYYLGDETHGYPMKVLDVSEPDNIISVATFDAGTENVNQTIPHNQIVACNYLYVSYYYDGIRVYDISDPAAPELSHYYDTSLWPFDNNYRGAWGIYPYLPSGNIIVSDMQKGLYVLSGPGDICSDREESILSCSLVSDVDNPLPEATAITVFPQPASRVLQVQVQGLASQENVKGRLLDLNGRSLHRFSSTPLYDQRIEWPLPVLPNGMYLLEITGEDWQEVRKVIVQQ